MRRLPAQKLGGGRCACPSSRLNAEGLAIESSSSQFPACGSSNATLTTRTGNGGWNIPTFQGGQNLFRIDGAKDKLTIGADCDVDPPDQGSLKKRALDTYILCPLKDLLTLSLGEAPVRGGPG